VIEAKAAYIAVGSNIEPLRHVPLALTLLQARVTLTAVSTFYWTKPVGPTPQPPFANGVIRCETLLSPRELKFDVLREVERQVGRVRNSDKYAPRCIDLDLVLYDALVMSEEGLELPDPDVWERPFIAVPLLEVCPECILPDSGASLAESPAAVPAADMTADPAMTQMIRNILRL
jgi:dihydroneopterin aldolase/2-amino-4-hydroxy-6-hydroxymethyldihydropteridine diphosphokinase